ncbi:YhgE/Pip domain-containing protein [Eggerthella guodeyinii]|uniref:YhgE/Pip domain-containing protein n=1 Tax=Eggerthella guodeyinii TaxID=2690837 RepID=A0A6L7IVA4_9ACTN|nr:YhgE/Pip domain-containing protein [Eggerthella guodeyinii]QOS69113.1 YhgE/Pip domain-containing protein [Eggerthella guodeyinii]
MSFKGLRFAGLEWKNITASKVMWVVIAAIAIMPLLYGALYLAAFQDPYARLNTVPVAVVNEDAGAIISAEQRNLGDDVVQELKDTDDGLQWHFVSADEAQKGLEDGTYFMTCTIPSDFSASVASVDGDSPEKAQLKIDYNQSENMLASQIGETVWKEVRTRVSDTVATEYWTTVLGRVADSGKDIQTAADGAGDLEDGLVTAKDGSAAITSNLGTLKDGALTLDTGLGSLVAGASSLDAGLGTLSGGTSTLKAGTQSLVAGANQLHDGASQVAGGASSVSSGASKLQSDGTSKVAAGASQLAEATSALPDEAQADEAEAGSNQISGGIAHLQGAAGELAGGVSQLKSGLDTVSGGAGALEAGARDAQAGATSLKAGIGTSGQTVADQTLYGLLNSAQAALEGGDTATARGLIGAAQEAAGSLSAGAAQLETGTGSLVSGAQQLQAGIGSSSDTSATTLYGGANLLADGIGASSDASATTLYGGLNSLSAGYESLSSQLLPLVRQSPALRAAVLQLDAGANEVNANMSSLVAGSSQVASGASQVNDGAASAVSGAGQLDAGASQLVDGAQSAKSGAGQLSAGAQSAKDGSARIADGATQLQEGSGTLTTGLADAVDGSGELAGALADGAKTAADQTSNIDGKSEVMSDPVELVNEYYTTVKNYGTGFAPYFMALGLWVGGLVAGFVFKPLNSRLIMSGANPVTVAFANYLPVAFFSLIQATLLMVVLQFGLQLQIDNVPAFYAMGYLTALVFAAIMQVLMAAFGFPGKFVAIILLMLQLTACAGTFPIQTTPDFFQAINPYMPMTYVVQGMRQIMTGLDYGIVGFDCLVLFAIGAVCFALTCLVAYRKRTVRMEDLHPVLQLG